jgi:amylosucrase
MNALDTAVAADFMLHAWMLMLKGIPVLYSGDEIGMLNDNAYHLDPDKAADSRNLHRGDFRWDLAEHRNDPETLTGRIFEGITRLINIRRENQIFHSDANMYPVNLGDDRVLGVVREYKGQKMLGIYNFSEHRCRTEIETADWNDMTEPEREYIPGEGPKSEYWIEPYGFRWFIRDL